MSGAATLELTPTRPRPVDPPAKPGLERRAALAAVIAESRGAVEEALRVRRTHGRPVALRLWRPEDRTALQPRFVQLGVAGPDGVRWGRAILLRAESHNPLYLASKQRLLADGGADGAAEVLAAIAAALSTRLPCSLVDPVRG